MNLREALTKKKPSKGWSIFDLSGIVFLTISLVLDFKGHDWVLAAIDLFGVLFFSWALHKDWAWYPKVEEPENLDKTKELKDDWKF